MSTANNGVAAADALVLFGATGDLAHKMIFPALYAMVKRGALAVPVIGLGRSTWDLRQLRERARDSIAQHAGGIDDEQALERLSALLRYVDGDYNDAGTFTALKAELSDARHPAFYLAIPPSLFETVIERLCHAGLAGGARVHRYRHRGARDVTPGSVRHQQELLETDGECLPCQTAVGTSGAVGR